MTYYEQCPMPVEGGGDCFAAPHPASRFGLCVAHWRDVVQDWVADLPEVARRCPSCQMLNMYDSADWVDAQCAGCGVSMAAPWIVTDNAELAAARRAPDVGPSGVVYYVQRGDRIKIGYSGSFDRRMAAISHDRVLATEPGDFAREKARHHQFAEFLVPGEREWFYAVPALVAHAAALRAEHGDPRKLARRVEAAQAYQQVLRDFGSLERFNLVMAELARG